ncbi:DUF6931 family protein [Aliiruegeria lutimaris]|uniref:Uncharacterized protein n=1 Tax=Aliiruegeria lutimaris TaxID=571298 RepID=A0A1G8K661_9RHOB|nr:hypothetical protein [Aliiruegeria lutimaris]SDI38928.1 hypothetical protein SAMN04488026_1002159 [Aliiruegeria lutimaris]
MGGRFEDLNKIPQVPAARIMAQTNLSLETELEGPASAGVSQVLAELGGREAVTAKVDMLKVMAASLPPRELTWWACLAGRDVIGQEATPPATLAAAEAWVFRPSEETREAAFRASEAAGPRDNTSLCALLAVYADGTLGPGDLKEFPAPEGGAAAIAFGMNVMAIDARGGDFTEAADLMLDRALDIARGGNGHVEQKNGEDE